MSQKRLSPDPLFINAFREARIILFLWLLSGIVTVGICYTLGYLSHEPDLNSTGPDLVRLLNSFEALDRDPETLTTPLGLGIPDWIFYGVVLPWIVCILLTFWFCFRYFSEDDLGAEESLDQTSKNP